MNYSEYVRGLIKDAEVGQAIKVDLCDEHVSRFRMTLRAVSGEMVFITKVHINGECWIRREL